MHRAAIDLDPLRRATAALQAALEVLDGKPEGVVGQIIRDGAIKRFEFTFELAWETLRRLLVADGDTDVIPTTGARAILRRGRQAGYVVDVEAWFKFLEARNDSSHSYDEEVAHEVALAARTFLPAVVSLLERLELAVERNAT